MATEALKKDQKRGTQKGKEKFIRDIEALPDSERTEGMIPRTSDIAKILNHYGRTHQEWKALEELAELQVAITHQGTAEEVKTEIADVLIMAEQIRLMWNISPAEVVAEIDRKVDRTLERIEHDNKRRSV